MKGCKGPRVRGEKIRKLMLGTGCWMLEGKNSLQFADGRKRLKTKDWRLEGRD